MSNSQEPLGKFQTYIYRSNGVKVFSVQHAIQLWSHGSEYIIYNIYCFPGIDSGLDFLYLHVRKYDIPLKL